PEKRIQNARGNRHSDRVVDKCKKQVLADVAHRRLAQLAGAHNAGEISLDEGDAAAFDRDVGSSAHSNADVGLRKRWGIVDAVAGHGNHSSLLLKLSNHFGFPGGKYLGFELINADLIGDFLRDRAVVTSEHDNV